MLICALGTKTTSTKFLGWLLLHSRIISYTESINICLRLVLLTNFVRKKNFEPKSTEKVRTYWFRQRWRPPANPLYPRAANKRRSLALTLVGTFVVKCYVKTQIKQSCRSAEVRNRKFNHKSVLLHRNVVFIHLKIGCSDK